MHMFEDAYPETTLILDGSNATTCFNVAEESKVKVRKVVFFHLSRNEGGNVDLKAVEEFKDGRFLNTKYRGKRNKSKKCDNFIK